MAPNLLPTNFFSQKFILCGPVQNSVSPLYRRRRAGTLYKKNSSSYCAPEACSGWRSLYLPTSGGAWQKLCFEHSSMAEPTRFRCRCPRFQSCGHSQQAIQLLQNETPRILVFLLPLLLCSQLFCVLSPRVSKGNVEKVKHTPDGPFVYACFNSVVADHSVSKVDTAHVEVVHLDDVRPWYVNVLLFFARPSTAGVFQLLPMD